MCMTHHTTSHHITHHITSHHHTPHHIKSHYITHTHHLTPSHTITHHLTPSHITSHTFVIFSTLVYFVLCLFLFSADVCQSVWVCLYWLTVPCWMCVLNCVEVIIFLFTYSGMYRFQKWGQGIVRGHLMRWCHAVTRNYVQPVYISVFVCMYWGGVSQLPFM